MYLLLLFTETWRQHKSNSWFSIAILKICVVFSCYMIVLQETKYVAPFCLYSCHWRCEMSFFRKIWEGYSKNKRYSKTRLLIHTTEIFLRRLKVDPNLVFVSHISVDEVHERDLNTKFLLITLKYLLIPRISLKCVLRSDTLDDDTFLNNFPLSYYYHF